jgi:hypothetical protein
MRAWLFGLLVVFGLLLVPGVSLVTANNATTGGGDGDAPSAAPVCDEGSFLDQGATCTSCSSWMSKQPACILYDTCCGAYGCGTYVSNAQGSAACFNRLMDKSVNILAPSFLGALSPLCASCWLAAGLLLRQR